MAISLPLGFDEHLDAIRNELLRVFYYLAGRCKLTVLESFPDLTYLAAAEQLIAQDRQDLRSIGFWAMARCLPDGETITLSSTSYSKYDLFMEAVRCDPNFGLGHNGLASMLKSLDDVVVLPDGRTLNRLGLCFEALRLDPTAAQVYVNLGATQNLKEPLLMPDGRELSKRDLFLEALRYERNYPIALNNLGCMISSSDTVTLADGATFSDRELFIEALRIDPGYSSAYSNLARSLSTGETASLADGQVMSKPQLYLQALRLNPGLSQSYHGLALVAPDTCELPDGRILTKLQLLLESLRCDPKNNAAFVSLRKILLPTQPWTRATHAIIFREHTNTLFASLLLAVQRLEDTCLLPMAHQAMLEDIFEGWTWADALLLSSGAVAAKKQQDVSFI